MAVVAVERNFLFVFFKREKARASKGLILHAKNHSRLIFKEMTGPLINIVRLGIGCGDNGGVGSTFAFEEVMVEKPVFTFAIVNKKHAARGGSFL